MNNQPAAAEPDGSAGAPERFQTILSWLDGDQSTGLGHAELERQLDIEGACRHLVKDRMNLTGARWGLHGAEAVLKLRALRSNGDVDAYWHYHLDEEQRRVHSSRYADNTIPQAA